MLNAVKLFHFLGGEANDVALSDIKVVGKDVLMILRKEIFATLLSNIENNIL